MRTQPADNSGWEPVTDPNELKSINSDNSGWQPVTDQNEIDKVNGYPDSNLKGVFNKLGRAAGIVGQDVENAPGKLGQWLIEKLNIAPSELGGAVNQEINDPKRYGRNIVTGIGQARNAAVNIPYQLPRYLAHIGLISPETANKFPHATENQTNMFSPGEQKQPGDAFLQGYPGAISYVPGAAKVAGAVGGELAEAGKSIGEPFTGSKRLAPLNEQMANAGEETKAAEESENLSKSNARVATGSSTWETLENKKNVAQNQLEKLTNDSQQHYVDPSELDQARNNYTQANNEFKKAKAESEGKINLSNPFKIQDRINVAKSNLDDLKKSLIDNPPKTLDEFNQAKINLENAKKEHEDAKIASVQKFNTSNPDKIQNNINNNEEKINQVNKDLEAIPENKPVDLDKSQENVSNAEATHNEAKKISANADNAIQQHLNPSADYKMRVSRELNHRIQSINDYHSSEYKKMMKDLKDNNFELGNASRLDQINKAADKARVEFGDDPEGEFARLIKLAPTSSDTKASDFMMHQKDFRDAIYNTYQSAIHEGREGSKVRATELFRVARALKPFEDIVNQTLREGLGEHLPRYDQLQQGYREQVYPLRENATANKITSGKPMSSNIAEELNGDQEGQALLRELAKQNPEVLRNIAGQHDLKDIINPDEVLREYTNEMPELTKLVDMRQRALNNQNEAKSNLDNANMAHENNQKLNKENEKNQSEFDKKNAIKNQLTEKNDLMKQFKENIENRQKNMSEAQIQHDNLAEVAKQHQKVKDDIDNLEKTLPILDKHLAEILKTGEQKQKYQTDVKNLESKQQQFEKAKAKFEGQKDSLEQTIKNADQHSAELKEAQKATNLSKEKQDKIQKDIDKVNASVKKARRIFGALSVFYLSYKGLGVIKALFSGNKGE